VAAAALPTSVTVAPAVASSGQFAYVTNYVASTVTAYAIDPTTGALTEVGVAVATGIGPNAIAIVDPFK
jgi:6-phosphogluconolactonase (cycloisomerase 2 family)